MKIKVLCLGKSTPEFIALGVEYYLKKIKPMCAIDWVEIHPKKKFETPENTLKYETELIENHLALYDKIILLDNNGQQYSSENWAKEIEQYQLISTKSLVFIIGGAFGFSPQIYDKASRKISLSKMTFSHQNVRLIFLEQLYRAYSIINHLPYHNG